MAFARALPWGLTVELGIAGSCTQVRKCCNVDGDKTSLWPCGPSEQVGQSE